MKQWLADQLAADCKKPLPILSFPACALLGATVRDMTTDSELQAKGMAAIAARTNAAAAVSFMDLSVEAECFGATIVATDDEVPTVKERIIFDTSDAEALTVPAVGTARSGLYVDTVKKAAERITDRPVLAGMIGPFSLAARLYDVSKIMMECYDDPDTVHAVLEKITAFLIEYAKAYRTAGAGGIMMAEPVAGLLSPALEEEFSSPYVKRICDAVQDDGFLVIYHNCGDNVPKMLDSILSTSCAAYHFGNAVDIEEDILKKVPESTVVMGNLDPVSVLRMGTPAEVREATLALLARCSKYQNFLLSSGCDMPPATPWENIDAFFAAAKEFYRA